MTQPFPGPAVAISPSGQPLAQGPPGPAGPAGPAGPQGPSAAGGASDGQTGITLSNGLNSNIVVGNTAVVQRINPTPTPTAAFSIGGFAMSPSPVGAQRLSLQNTTVYPMTVVHEDASSSVANRISVGSGRSVVVPPFATVNFQYDGTGFRWVLQNPGLARPKHFNVVDFGAKGQGNLVTDGTYSTISGQVGSGSANFTSSAVVGMLVVLLTPGSSTVYYGSIASLVSNSAITVTWTSSTPPNISGGILEYCFDDSAAIDACLAAAKTALISGLYATAPEVYFPAGRYGRSTSMLLDKTYDGLRITGTSSRATAATLSVIAAMVPMTYLVQQNQCGITWSDLWLRGCRQCSTATYEITAPTFGSTSTVHNYWERMRWDGPTVNGYAFHVTGLGEIDNSGTLNCNAAGDTYDGTYRVAAVCRSDNPEAFQWDWVGGVILGGIFGVQFSNGSSFNIRGAQIFECTQALIQIQSSCAGVEFENVYNEGDSCYFLRLDATGPVNGVGTIRIRKCFLTACPVYTAHTQELVIEECTLGADIYSDPEAARFVNPFSTGTGAVACGTQLLHIKRSIFANGTNVVYQSGTKGAGSLVLIEDCINEGTTNITETDGIVSGTALSFASSTPLAHGLEGAPIEIPGAGASGGTYYGFLKSVTSSSAGTLQSPVTTNIASGATVIIGNTGWWNGTEYFQPYDVRRLPGLVVQDAQTLTGNASVPPSPATWVASTSGYVVGQRAIPTVATGFYYEVLSTLGTATSGSTNPFTGSASTTVGLTLVDNVGANQITWITVGPTQPTSFDANGLVLGCSGAPTQSGIIIAGDWILISGLTAPRSFEISEFGLQPGPAFTVHNISSFPVTLLNIGTPVAVLSANQRAEIWSATGSGLFVYDTNSREKTETTIINVTESALTEAVVSTLGSFTAFASTMVQITGVLGPGINTWTSGSGILRLRIGAVGSGLSGTIVGSANCSETLPTTGAPSVVGLATGLTAGNTYDINLTFESTGGAGYTTGTSCKGGITAREVN